jgi:hypothetical protein
VLVGNQEAGPSGSDSGGLLADLLEGARRRNLSANSLTAYKRTWTGFWPRRQPRASIRGVFLFLIPSPKLFIAGAGGPPQSPRGGADHRPRVAPQRGDDPA